MSIYRQCVQDLFQPKLKAQITLSPFLKGPNMVSHQLTVVVINVKDPWDLLTSFLSFWWPRQPEPVCHLTIYKTEGGKAFKHDIGFSLNSLMSSRESREAFTEDFKKHFFPSIVLPRAEHFCLLVDRGNPGTAPTKTRSTDCVKRDRMEKMRCRTVLPLSSAWWSLPCLYSRVKLWQEFFLCLFCLPQICRLLRGSSELLGHSNNATLWHST